jgi:dTDP-4-dehydrorhamnose reductase
MQSVVVLGGSGLVGSRLVELWRDRFELLAPTHAQLDVLDEQALGELLRSTNPSALVNLAAWADVDRAEQQRGDECGAVYQLNAASVGRLAALCHEYGTYLVHVSTDYVFDGMNDLRPYREGDPTNPLCWYAHTKLAGEDLIRNRGGPACIARIQMPFTARAHRKRDFARMCLARLSSGEPVTAVDDQRITPVFLDDAIEALYRLIELHAIGTFHVASASWTTPYQFARAIAARLGLDRRLVHATDFESFAATRPARRPRHSWLDVSKVVSLIGRGVLRGVDEQLEAWTRQALPASELVR